MYNAYKAVASLTGNPLYTANYVMALFASLNAVANKYGPKPKDDFPVPEFPDFNIKDFPIEKTPDFGDLDFPL
jgi:hypothetical protein